MPEAGDRRRFFRINDEVDLYFRKIVAQEAREDSYIDENVLTSAALPQIMAAVEREMDSLMARIEAARPETAEYLKLLNYKVDILAQCILNQSDLAREKNSYQVSLSASGLAFGSEQALSEGDFLELKILLPASRALVTTCCRVVQCRRNPVKEQRYPYVVSVDYINMKEEDREVLVKHVVKRQLAQIRALKAC
ncbi:MULTISPECIES: PilZ domain-containing protein [Methylomicrobium]|uniref:PilZ domain-containing protein n=1 Tax=Methylomicrobium album BG8 TaxID=686340 RepID=H8GFX1_METAL|nr:MULTISPECIES: PilZ domain-containing protein [Methylomicrobium]EIC28722.1 PilZ domain-containing protein [Methylomicrobium album BG8]